MFWVYVSDRVDIVYSWIKCCCVFNGSFLLPLALQALAKLVLYFGPFTESLLVTSYITLFREMDVFSICVSLDFLGCYMYFLLASNILDEVAISGPFSLHLSHQDSVWLKPDLRIRWCHLSTIPGTTPHCLVSTEGNINFLGTRNLVYICVWQGRSSLQLDNIVVHLMGVLHKHLPLNSFCILVHSLLVTSLPHSPERNGCVLYMCLTG